jgi:hypothetical protein
LFYNRLFALSDEVGYDLQMYNKQKILVDLPQMVNFLANIDPTISASTLNNSISNALSFASWPGIDVSNFVFTKKLFKYLKINYICYLLYYLFFS